MTAVFFGIMLTPTVDRFFCGIIRVVLEKFTFLGGRHYRKLLQLGDGLSISEHQFFTDKSLTPEKVKAELGGFSVLAVKRQAGATEVFSLDIGSINPGDSLILFGHDDEHDNLSAA